MLSRHDVWLLLAINQSGFFAVLLMQIVVLVLWMLAGGLIPGFALYDGAVGGVNAYTHTGWWMVIDLFAVLFGAVATYFGLSYSTSTGRIEKGASKVMDWIVAYMVILGINAFGNHTVHAVLTGLEAGACTSSLCVNSYWAIWTFFALLILSVLINVWLMLRVRVYYNDLKYGILHGKLDLDLSGPPEDVEKPAPAPSAPPGDAFKNARLKTPLLAASKHGRR